ncbi:hypothetical protein WMZ97_11330 [Lentibacillus sp. N15]|uniref:hypothetical protein n=1 Tax=Lentibacillus songyuanensis TaxID=3136161 RepID=UPI0031B9E620
MADPEKPTQGIAVLIGVIAALLSGQILKGYEMAFIPRILLTLVIAVAFWYIFRFVGQRGKDK